MPLYQMECTRCNRQEEVFKKYESKELTVCPECGGEMVKAVGKCNFSLKGSGWAKDGYGGNR